MTLATINGPGGFSVSHTAGGTSSAATGCNKISAWSLSFRISSVETTGWVDNGNEVHEAVKIGVDYQVSGVAQSGTGAGIGPIPIGLANSAPTFSSATTTATFTASTGCTISFSALLTGSSISRSVDGNTSLVETGKSRGPITLVWA
jgi:hypothetical protein